jgi:rubredoxin
MNAKYKCTVCGYIYDPENWVCPVCGVAKDQFEKLD